MTRPARERPAMPSHPTELLVPAITPFAADHAVDHGAFLERAQALLEAGAHGLAPFGTTSEANSLTVAERRAALEALVEGGIEPGCLVPGTGCCAVADTVELSRHAAGLGCRGVLMLPPFFYKGVPEDGVYDAFAQAIEGVGPGARIYLYHIPQMSGVPITLPLIGRLVAAFGTAIAGLKDSSGDWENTAAVIAAYPQLATYSASEAMIPRNVAAGGAGCISASANVNPAGIRRLIDGLGGEGEEALLEQVSEVRRLFEGLPLVPAVKAAVAAQAGAEGLARVRPPLRAMAPDDAGVLRAVDAAGPQAS